MSAVFREPKMARSQRRLLRNFNECITCRLCDGYLIEPTTVNECMHTYCRSCIVSHLGTSETCPNCVFPFKDVYLDQLRPDPQLKALVYKLVPGLCQSERQRQHAFHEASHHHDTKRAAASTQHPAAHTKCASHPPVDISDRNERDSIENRSSNHEHSSTKVASAADLAHLDGSSGGGGATALMVDDEDSFLSADDPISLALEYHPRAVSDNDADRIPATKYLLCPAAITVYHLQRFLAAKFGLSIETTIGGRIDIQIISDDEVLPNTLTLMDVAYCSKWKRIKPLQLYYQIFINLPDSLPPTGPIVTQLQFDANVDGTTVSNTTPTLTNVLGHHELNKQLKFKQSLVKATPYHNNLQTLHSKSDHNAKHRNNHYDDDDDDDDDDDTTMQFNQYSISTDKPTKPTKVTLIKNHNTTNGATSTSDANKLKPVIKASSDFKSLRSNDIRYTSEVCAPKTPTKERRLEAFKVPQRSPASATAMGRRKSVADMNPDARSSFNDVFSRMKRQHDEEVKKSKSTKSSTTNHKQTPTENGTTAITHEASAKHCIPSSQPSTPPKAPSIVVCIPPQRRRNSMSDEHLECLSLARLKTAKKKSKVVDGFKQSVSVDESVMRKYVTESKVEKRNVPILKIELHRLTKDAQCSNKSDDEVQSPPFEMISFPTSITEYAKHIGLKPIEATSQLETPPVSADDTESTSQESKEDDMHQKSVHKKRKKSNKHSKEPGSKRPRMHAEISSQQEKSLKFKLKLTAANKSSKSERKASFSSSSNDSTTGALPVVAKKVSKTPKRVETVVDSKKNKKSSKANLSSDSTANALLPVVAKKVSKSIEVLESLVIKPSSSIVNYSEFMGASNDPDPDVIITNVTYPKARPISARRQSAVAPRPKATPIQRPRTPDIIPSHSYRHASGVSYLNTSVSMINNASRPLPPLTSSPNKSCTLKRSMSVDCRPPTVPKKPKKLDATSKCKKSVPDLIRTSSMTRPNKQTNLYPELHIQKAMPKLLSTDSINFTKMSDQSTPNTNAKYQPVVEIFQIPPNSKVFKVPPPTLKTPPRLARAFSPPIATDTCKKMKGKMEPFAGFNRDGALDLSGSKTNEGHDLSIKFRPPSQRSPIPCIDITTPTKAATEPDSRAKSPIEVSKPKANNWNENKQSTDASNPSNTHPNAGLNILYSALLQTPPMSQPINWISQTIKHPDTVSDMLTRKVNELLLNEQRLQNLKLLSESALNREKLRMPTSPMFSTIHKPRPTTMPKLNDIHTAAAASRNTAVRQQNASIRNIPNPSALAFRHRGLSSPQQQQPAPLVTSSDSYPSAANRASGLMVSTSSLSPSVKETAAPAILPINLSDKATIHVHHSSNSPTSSPLSSSLQLLQALTAAPLHSTHHLPRGSPTTSSHISSRGSSANNHHHHSHPTNHNNNNIVTDKAALGTQHDTELIQVAKTNLHSTPAARAAPESPHQQATRPTTLSATSGGMHGRNTASLRVGLSGCGE